MRTIITIFAMMILSFNMQAQNRNELPINSVNIESILTGDWIMTKVQPSDKVVLIQSFKMKGTGYGEIVKSGDNKEVKTIFSKIFSMNNNSIVFADAEGNRIQYKVVSLNKNFIQLTDGTATIDFTKK